MLRLRFSFCYSQEKKFLEDFIFGFACEMNQPNICLQIDFTTLKYVEKIFFDSSGKHNAKNYELNVNKTKTCCERTRKIDWGCEIL